MFLSLWDYLRIVMVKGLRILGHNTSANHILEAEGETACVSIIRSNPVASFAISNCPAEGNLLAVSTSGHKS